MDEVIKELIDYTRYHFKGEEAIMKICNYPDLEAHRGLHQKLITQVNDLAETWRKDRDPNSIHRFRDFLRD